MKEFQHRVSRLLEKLGEKKLDSFLVSLPANLFYLFGFSGSTGLALLRGKDAELLVDSRYLRQAEEETRQCTVSLVRNLFGEELTSRLTGSRIGFEADHLSYNQVNELTGKLGAGRLIPTSRLVEEQRAVKSPSEIQCLRRAFGIAHSGLERFRDQFSWGLAETAAAGLLDYCCRLAGSEGYAFDTIMASGPQSALPHARPGEVLTDQTQVLLIDFGVRAAGYCSDLTRVILPESDEARRLSEVVRQAQTAAIRAVRPGIEASQVDEAARSVIREAGYGAFFGHGTGHGLGMQVHEYPRIAPGSDHLLQTGMVFTVEPGIYLPGKFGVRIEDVLVVTEQGCELLSNPDHGLQGLESSSLGA